MRERGVRKGEYRVAKRKTAKPRSASPGKPGEKEASAKRSSRPAGSAKTKTQATPAKSKKGTAGAARASSNQSGVSQLRTNEVGSNRKPRTSALSAALAAAAGPPITVVEDDRKLPKTTLTRKELREFELLLLARRRELVGSVGNLTDEALGRNRRDASGDLSSMPIHMADLGSDNWEQEFTLGLIDNERKLLREMDEALARIADGTYGICLATHSSISKERLLAKPWAKYCIEYARAQEAGRVP